MNVTVVWNSAGNSSGAALSKNRQNKYENVFEVESILLGFVKVYDPEGIQVN